MFKNISIRISVMNKYLCFWGSFKCSFQSTTDIYNKKKQKKENLLASSLISFLHVFPSVWELRSTLRPSSHQRKVLALLQDQAMAGQQEQE